MHRHKSYDIELAAQLSDLDFARSFILDLMEDDEGLEALDALKHTIRRMGVKEFSNVSNIPYESICRMLESNKIPKLETLGKYFAVFGLKVKIALQDAA